jgi:hypothetical protein
VDDSGSYSILAPSEVALDTAVALIEKAIQAAPAKPRGSWTEGSTAPGRVVKDMKFGFLVQLEQDGETVLLHNNNIKGRRLALDEAVVVRCIGQRNDKPEFALQI